MAAATVTSTVTTQMGHKRIVIGRLTAPANNDTWDTGLKAIHHVGISYPGGNLAAADAISHTESGGTITIKVVGTARDLSVLVVGI